MSSGLLLVISGPSGVGKGTICRELKEADPSLYLSVSVTTRPPRAGEKEGEDYFFVSEERFLKMVEQGELLEWARVYSYYYGTPLEPVLRARSAGKDVLLEIDVQGGFKVREKVPDSILIFILPPSVEELEARLRKRGTESSVAVAERLQWARKELSFYRHYDYAIVNDRVADVVAKINAIRIAEKCRPRNLDFVFS